MPALFSPPQQLLQDLSGELLACNPQYYRQLAFWGPRINVVATDRRGRRRGNPRGAIAITGSREALEGFFGAPVPEPAILTVDEKRIGILDIVGFLAKSDGPGRAGLVTLRIQLGELVDQADAVLLRIDSPGGTVAGTGDLAAAIKEARQKVPVFGFAEDLCAASAYWIAAQAEKLYANVPTAMIGGVGMFVGLYERKEQFAKAGVRAVVIKSGEFKAAGWPGTKITEAQRAYWQKLIDQAQAEFIAAIKHRADPAKVATGRLYVASDSQRLKLIDGVKSFDDVIAELAAKVKR